MKSMTGFGSARSRSRWAEIEVSVRSVNGRFLDPRFHLPREYAAIEGELKKILKSNVSRGTLDISVSRRPGPLNLQGEIRVQTGLAKKWLRTYRELAQSLAVEAKPDLTQILRYPEIFKIEERVYVTGPETNQALRTFAQAVRSLERERLREGRALRLDLSENLSRLRELVRRMEKQKNLANRALRKRMVERLEKLSLSPAVDSQRVAQEIALYLDRSDISEEIARLKEHVWTCGNLLKVVHPIGKKLDFYTQELMREANTIGSKAQLPSLTNAVVEAKTLIERIREQVQNIE